METIICFSMRQSRRLISRNLGLLQNNEDTDRKVSLAIFKHASREVSSVMDVTTW